MKTFYSDVVLKFAVNNFEAESKEDYIEKVKDYYLETYGIELVEREIENITSEDITE